MLKNLEVRNPPVCNVGCNDLFLGAQQVMEKLHTSIEKGLTPNDFDVRTEFFSTNYKAPPRMTPYWRLFLNALDDFMLKFLSVCAVVQLVIEVSFADASHRSTCKY